MTMDFEAILRAVRDFSAADRARLMSELGPELCSALMAHPDLAERMMQRCEAMMKDQAMQESFPLMRQRMMEWMRSGGERNG